MAAHVEQVKPRMNLSEAQKLCELLQVWKLLKHIQNVRNVPEEKIREKMRKR